MLRGVCREWRNSNTFSIVQDGVCRVRGVRSAAEQTTERERWIAAAKARCG